MKDLSKIEIPFEWTCPHCGHKQTDTVNPVHGPFLTVTCGQCIGTADDTNMSEADWVNFDSAVIEAENIAAKATA